MARTKPAYTLFQVLLNVRDARSTTGSQRELLYALAFRCKPHELYSCFPSYAVLAKDTGLTIQSLRRAAQKLEKAGLISRKQRGYYTNLFHINARLLAAQAAEQRELDRKERHARKVAEKSGEAPFDPHAEEDAEGGNSTEAANDSGEQPEEDDIDMSLLIRKGGK